MDFNEIRMEYLQHFLTGGGYPIRINPLFYLTEEEEMLTIMFIQENMPYLEVYHGSQWKETMVKKVSDIPLKDQVEYYKKELSDAQNYYWNKFDKLQEILEA